MTIRPDAEQFIIQAAIEAELLHQSDNAESALFNIKSIMDLYQDYILEQQTYIHFLEKVSVGLGAYVAFKVIQNLF